MKIVVIIARILLGAIFVAFGLNAFLHFLPSGYLRALQVSSWARCSTPTTSSS